MDHSKSKNDKVVRAIQLRDAALVMLQQHGIWEKTNIGKGLSVALVGAISVAYRTPFQRLPEPSDYLKYCAAQLGVHAPKNLPYGLDIWAPKKVLNIEWDDKGNVELVSFRRGDWENTLLGA
jgi:hypothetical protein